MEDFKNILVVTNSTKYCRQALHYGISLAKRYNAEVHVLHLMHDPFNLDHWQLALPSLKSIKKEPLPVKEPSFCLRADRVQPCEAY
jgi:hypothetical protein